MGHGGLPSLRVLTLTSVLLLMVTLMSEDHVYGAASVIQPDDQGVQRATIAMDSYSYSPNELSVQLANPSNRLSEMMPPSSHTCLSLRTPPRGCTFMSM